MEKIKIRQNTAYNDKKTVTVIPKTRMSKIQDMDNGMENPVINIKSD